MHPCLLGWAADGNYLPQCPHKYLTTVQATDFVDFHIAVNALLRNFSETLTWEFSSQVPRIVHQCLVLLQHDTSTDKRGVQQVNTLF